MTQKIFKYRTSITAKPVHVIFNTGGAGRPAKPAPISIKTIGEAGHPKD